MDQVSLTNCHQPFRGKPDEDVGALKVPDKEVLAISYYLVNAFYYFLLRKL